MKMNWGWGIAIFYTSFVVIMLMMVVYSTKNKVHLVQEKYYDKDLNYEAFRQKRENANLLNDELSIQYIASLEQLELRFPTGLEVEEGSITLFRPSNRFQDRKFDIRPDQRNSMSVPLSDLEKGLWKVQLDFKSKDQAFYKEQHITL